MAHELTFASIRQGDVTATEAWKLVSPIVDTDDRAIAMRLSEALRAWVWKALDRRRRDASLREWIDLLNRVEGFLGERFEAIAARIDVLAELLHESITVADMANPEDLLRRKHVKSILVTLGSYEGEWADRAALMDELELKPANTTRLMALLVDIGWVEQEVNGREAAYRLSVEGIAKARALGKIAVARPVIQPINREYRRHFSIAPAVRAYTTKMSGALHLFGDDQTPHHEWERAIGDFTEVLEIDHHDQIEQDDFSEFQGPQLKQLRA